MNRARPLVLISSLAIACTLGACGSETETDTQVVDPGETNSQTGPVFGDPPAPEPKPQTPFTDGPPTS